jgi:hypothetical protein
MEEIRNIWGAEVEIIPDFPQMEEYLGSGARDEEIMDLLKRRPCTAEEISRALGYKLDCVFQCLGDLNRKHAIDYRMFHNRCYYEKK